MKRGFHRAAILSVKSFGPQECSVLLDLLGDILLFMTAQGDVLCKRRLQNIMPNYNCDAGQNVMIHLAQYGLNTSAYVCILPSASLLNFGNRTKGYCGAYAKAPVETLSPHNNMGAR